MLSPFNQITTLDHGYEFHVLPSTLAFFSIRCGEASGISAPFLLACPEQAHISQLRPKKEMRTQHRGGYTQNLIHIAIGMATTEITFA